jgi:hypothetical protein
MGIDGRGAPLRRPVPDPGGGRRPGKAGLPRRHGLRARRLLPLAMAARARRGDRGRAGARVGRVAALHHCPSAPCQIR